MLKATSGEAMSQRNKAARVLLVLYALGSLAVVVPLLLGLPGTGELAGTTSGKILAAAVLSLGFGAAMASRDPWGNRVIVQVLIAFTALAAMAILIRVLFHEEPYSVDPAWMVLPFAAVMPVLFWVFYPQAPADCGSRRLPAPQLRAPAHNFPADCRRGRREREKRDYRAPETPRSPAAQCRGESIRVGGRRALGGAHPHSLDSGRRAGDTVFTGAGA
jgi:hypothetical protein